MLESAKEMLKRATVIIETVSDQENDCLDNTPENLRGSERYEITEQAVSDLNDVLDSVTNAIDILEDIVT